MKAIKNHPSAKKNPKAENAVDDFCFANKRFRKSFVPNKERYRGKGKNLLRNALFLMRRDGGKTEKTWLFSFALLKVWVLCAL